MRRIALQLTTLSPLSIRSDHTPDGITTARYIAGRAIIGSLATLHRLFHEQGEPEFKQLFLSRQVLYPDLFPATFDDKAQLGTAEWWNTLNRPVYPAPLTARTCKRYPGFLFAANDSYLGHGVRDSLFAWSIFKLINQGDDIPASMLELVKKQQQCEKCNKATRIAEDYYRRNESMLNRPMIAAHVSTRFQTHTGISRETGTVQQGILYSREVFREQTRFWGLLKTPDELAGPLLHFLQEVAESGLLRLGMGRSRGLGKVKLDVQLLDDTADTYSAFTERLKTFHERFTREIDKVPGVRKPDFTFALTLHSPTILYDELLRYHHSISEATLGRLVDLPADSFRQLYQVTDARRVTGWSEAWCLPRFHDLAMDTGSVFFFASNLGAEETLLRGLYRLEQEGIGEQRSEGFGRVSVSDPFHLEVKLR
jgi:CRISPR-associated protein Csx10